jgi:cytochrome P450
MAIHPEVQRKASKEIDSAIGPNRLPDFKVRKIRPYIEAIYRELMRWSPPLRLSLPHSLTEDDYYKGYFIPKGTLKSPIQATPFHSCYLGTVVLGNVW